MEIDNLGTVVEGRGEISWKLKRWVRVFGLLRSIPSFVDHSEIPKLGGSGRHFRGAGTRRDFGPSTHKWPVIVVEPPAGPEIGARLQPETSPTKIPIGLGDSKESWLCDKVPLRKPGYVPTVR